MTFLVVTINREPDSKLERFVLWLLGRFKAIDVKAFDEDSWAGDILQDALNDIDETAEKYIGLYQGNDVFVPLCTSSYTQPSFHEAAERFIADGEAQDQAMLSAFKRDMGLNP